MNNIEAEIKKSDYEIYFDSLQFKIDGEWLDEKLQLLYPDQMYRGLISTLLFAMEIDAESKIVWQRILPPVNTISICPILMCPDDCDFSCTLIMAEIEHTQSAIIWHRLGIDKSKEYWIPEKIGSDVEWFEKTPCYNFSIAAYMIMLEKFKTISDRPE